MLALERFLLISGQGASGGQQGASRGKQGQARGQQGASKASRGKQGPEGASKGKQRQPAQAKASRGRQVKKHEMCNSCNISVTLVGGITHATKTVQTPAFFNRNNSVTIRV